MPEGRRELEFRLQPMVEGPSHRFAFLLPDKIGAHRGFILGCSRTSFRHMLFGYPYQCETAFASTSNILCLIIKDRLSV